LIDQETFKEAVPNGLTKRTYNLSMTDAELIPANM
jgi:hypothetical protein